MQQLNEIIQSTAEINALYAYRLHLYIILENIISTFREVSDKAGR